MEHNAQIKNLTGKLNVLSGILRLGHECYGKENLSDIALHVLNNTRLISEYDMACLIDYRKGETDIIGVMGHESVNQNSEYCINIKKIIAKSLPLTEATEINIGDIRNEFENAEESLKNHLDTHSQGTMLLIPLYSPSKNDAFEGCFILVVEFFSGIGVTEKNKLTLLSKHYAEAIWYNVVHSRKTLFPKLLKYKKHLKPLKLIGCALFVLLLLLVFFRVNLNVAADFELIPTKKEIEYAPFSGKIGTVFYENGSHVRKGDTVIKYDNQELLYELSQVQNKYNRTSAELDLIRQKAFAKGEDLGKVKLVSLRRKAEEIEIEKLKWYLDKVSMKSKITGTVVVDRKEKLEGKVVQAGEKLFEIISQKDLEAEIMVNQRDASLLKKITSISLYLYAKPEEEITAGVISVSPKPELTQNRQFCYIVRVKLSKSPSHLMYGMRGVARVEGEKVSLGYYLFRNAILWYRKV